MTSKYNTNCPQCGTSICIYDVLTRQIEKELKCEQKVKEQSLSIREEALKKQAVDIEKSKKEIDVIIAKNLSEQIAKEKINLYKEAKVEAEREQLLKTSYLEEQLKSKDEKLQRATQNEIVLLNEKSKLEDAKRTFELEKTRQLDEEKNMVREVEKLKTAEKSKQLSDALSKVDKLQKQLEQGSQKAQGEILELEIESALKSTFLLDIIEPVPNGIRGGDIVQRVITPAGQEVGKIIWETKRTQTWQESWINKLKNDQRIVSAEFAVIVTQTMPKSINKIKQIEGVWIASSADFLLIAGLLRSNLIEVSEVRAMAISKGEKMDLLYSYLTGTNFKQRVESIVESFIAMREDLEREKRSTSKNWAAREKQITCMLMSTSGMHGDIQGIVGSNLPKIAYLEEQHLNEDTALLPN